MGAIRSALAGVHDWRQKMASPGVPSVFMFNGTPRHEWTCNRCGKFTLRHVNASAMVPHYYLPCVAW